MGGLGGLGGGVNAHLAEAVKRYRFTTTADGGCGAGANNDAAQCCRLPLPVTSAAPRSAATVCWGEKKVVDNKKLILKKSEKF